MDVSSTINDIKSLQELKDSLTTSYIQCSRRGLLYSASWAAELAHSIEVPLETVPYTPESSEYLKEFTIYNYGKSLFDLREFRRGAHVLKDCQSNEGVFLKLYCLFMAGEKQKEDGEVEALEEGLSCSNPFLQQIKNELAEREVHNRMDGFLYYLYGVVERELSTTDKARDKFLQSCSSDPLIWSAWEDLYKLCEDRNMLTTMEFPNHWMKDFFLAAASLELMQSNDALTYYNHLSSVGFSGSSYINTQLALVHYQLKDFPRSASLFKTIHECDPYKMTSIDVYSHVLFVMEMLPELYMLANDVENNDKYRAESCSVMGNFYSLHGDHEKACAYFKRAVRLNKTNHTSWILLGHEYLELKNHTLAIDAYTKAIETNKNDFRSFYGLGHTYEMLKMPYFALTYYKMAHCLQPSDSRVLYALGYCYDTLDQINAAKQCYKRAISLQDDEGQAIIKLAQLHVRLKEIEEATKLFTKYLIQIEMGVIATPISEDEGNAHLYLARYHLRRGQYHEAEGHAHKVTEFPSVNEEGKSILQEIYKLQDSAKTSTLLDELDLRSEEQLSPVHT